MDLDPESRRILEIARAARTPSAQDKARVGRRFALALGLSAGAASAASPAQAAAGVSMAESTAKVLALKWWAGGAVVLAAALASYAALPPAAPHVPAAAPQASAASAAAPAQRAASAPPAAAPGAAAPAIELADGPAALPAAEPVVAARAQQPTARRRTAAATKPTLAAELELLHRAQAAWRAREAERALSLVNQHRARYPRSRLRHERDALQVLSLCELGRRSQATRAARALLARDPRSPLRAAIERSCGLK
jgi:hypothetical protein